MIVMWTGSQFVWKPFKLIVIVLIINSGVFLPLLATLFKSHLYLADITRMWGEVCIGKVSWMWQSVATKWDTKIYCSESLFGLIKLSTNYSVNVVQHKGLGFERQPTTSGQDGHQGQDSNYNFLIATFPYLSALDGILCCMQVRLTFHEKLNFETVWWILFHPLIHTGPDFNCVSAPTLYLSFRLVYLLFI